MDNRRKRYTPKMFSEKVNELIVLLCSREGSEGGEAISTLQETLSRAPRGSLDQYGFLLQEGQPQTTDEVLYVKQKLSGATVMPSLTFKYSAGSEKIAITGFLLYDHSQGKGRKVKIKSGGLDSSSLKINVGMGLFTSSYDLTFIIFGTTKVNEVLRKASDENDLINFGKGKVIENDVINPSNIYPSQITNIVDNNENFKSQSESDEITNGIDSSKQTGISEDDTKAELHSDDLMGNHIEEGKIIPISIEHTEIQDSGTTVTEKSTNSPDHEDEPALVHIDKPPSPASDNAKTEESVNLSNTGDVISISDDKNSETVTNVTEDDDNIESSSPNEPLSNVGVQENIERVQKPTEGEGIQASSSTNEPVLSNDDLTSTVAPLSTYKDDDLNMSVPIEESTLITEEQTIEVKEDKTKDKVDSAPTSSKSKKTFLNITYL